MHIKQDCGFGLLVCISPNGIMVSKLIHGVTSQKPHWRQLNIDLLPTVPFEKSVRDEYLDQLMAC